MPNNWIVVHKLALSKIDDGDFAAADTLHRKALALVEKQQPDSLNLARAQEHLACLLFNKFRDYAAAEPLFRKALAIREDQQGPESEHVARSLCNIAHCLKSKGDYAAAEPLYRQALAINENHCGSEHARFGRVKTALLEIKRARERAGAAAAVAPPAPKRQKRSEESDGATEDDCVITGSRSAEERDAELLRNAISVAEDSDAEADAPKAPGEGAQPTCAGTLEDQLAKLRDGLEGDGFDVAVALTWCEENGADKLCEIVEAKMVDEFVASLALKPVKAKVLKARLRAFVAAGG
ncbi:hypothetical protein JL720_15183 [Aureococcus anophagefferens]|nr:hypothetical protein JL720_15183 [Aureococcus anophagefferens]